jgi:predicted XRE-type DNA-binding protein
MMKIKKKLPVHVKGSGNIFADLDLPNAEEHQLKAALVVQLKRLIAGRALTQTAAAKLTEMKQPGLSKFLRGDFRLVSVEKLMRMLTALNQDGNHRKASPQTRRGRADHIHFDGDFIGRRPVRPSTSALSAQIAPSGPRASCCRPSSS